MQRGKNKATWGLDALMDNLLVTEKQQQQQQPQRPQRQSLRSHSAAPRPSSTSTATTTTSSSSIHRIAATPLSHHSSIASSASTRSTQSRDSAFSNTSNTTEATLPVTVYEVPHSYDDDDVLRPNSTASPSTASSPITSTSPSNSSKQRIITLSPKIYVNQPHFVVAAFGMTDIARWLFDNIPAERESSWQVDSAAATLTFSPFTTKQGLLDLGDRIGISTFLVIASSLETFFRQLDILDNCMTGIDSDKLWWRRLVLIVDQATSSEMMQQREKVLHDQLPQILERYGMTHTPAVMFVSSSGKQYAEYTLQCKQVLRQLIDSNHRLGRWRPDEDEDDFLDAAVIHLTPQGKMPVRSMTRYNK